MKKANVDFVNATPNLVGTVVSATDAVLKLDTDNDGKIDTEITVKSDGTKTSKPI